MIEVTMTISATDQTQITEAIAVLQGLSKTPKSVKSKEPKKEEVKKEETSGIQLSDLRKVLALKVKDHREGIKSKLTELEAKNLTTLAEEKYLEFETFLNDLS